MDAEITIKNYRCFSDSGPAKIKFRRGITAIIGANNSGKSSLLKIFHEMRQIFDSIRTVNSNFQSALRQQESGLSIKSVLDVEEVFCNANDRGIGITIKFDGVEKEQLNEIQKELFADEIQIDILRKYNSAAWKVGFKVGNKVKRSGGVRSNTNFSVKDGILSNSEGPIAYIKHVQEFSEYLFNSIYVGAYRNAINIGGNADYYDLKVGQTFIQDWGVNKTGPDKKRNKLINSVSDNIKNIFGFEALEINASSNNQGFQITVNGESYNLNEMGSGLAQFIIVLGTAAMKNPSYIFIDEPELNLHPSLQLSFLTALASYARQGVIFSTHSMGLARSAAEFIYTVKRNGDGSSMVRPMENNPSLPELIGELSFSSRKELGFSKVLLVEGITEIKAIQQLLRKHKKDQHFLLIPLGGSAFINPNRAHELEEIKRISTNMYAIIDSEIENDGDKLNPDRQGFVNLCEKLGIDVHVLKRRALENYWTDRAVRLVFGEKYQALGMYERLEGKKIGWSKADNWRIAQEMTLNELSPTDLGQFLSKIKD